VLFALLAALAPDFDAPLPSNDFEEYVSAPAHKRSGAANLVSTTLGVAGDVEEEADEDEADEESVAFGAVASLDCAPGAEYQAAASTWRVSFARLSAHFCTGPPIL